MLLGVFGSTTGFIIYRMGNTVAYITAAIFALIGYVGLAICATYESPGGWLFFFTMLFLVVAGISAGIAIVAAICTPVENFTRRGSILMIVLLIGYFLFGYMFEISLRRGFFKTTKNSWYFGVFGVALAVIYFLCAFLIRETRHRFQDAVISLDQIGSFIFILVELVFFVILYFVFLKSHSYKLTAVLFIVLFILNFILVGVMIALSSKE